MKSDASTLEYAKLDVAGGGTGAVTLSAGVVIAAGTSAFTTKSNPAGAFIDDSSAQTISGAKTYSNSALVYRNPANTFSLTQVNPAITASYNTEFQMAATYLIYIAGSNKKRMNLSTRAVEDTNTDAYTVISAALAALPASSGAKIMMNSGLYTLSNTIIPPSYVHLEGEGQFGITQLRPTGDFPAIEMSGTSKKNIIIENFYITHNQPAYTSSLVNFKPTTAVSDCRLQHLSLYDFTNAVGSGIGLDATLGSIYRNNIRDCFSYGFENFINATVPSNVTTGFFANNNRFSDCQIAFPKRLLKLSGPANGAFDDNVFINCEMQSGASTLCGWDYETGYSGHCFYTVHVGCMVQDLPVGTKYALINTVTELNLIGCHPAWLIGGAGATTQNKVRSLDLHTVSRGRSTQSGNASTKVFNIAHGLSAAPTNVKITHGSDDATGSPTVTSDSTNVIITYPVAPPTGSSNLIWNWEATVF